MLSRLRVKRFKSLFDTEVDLEPLTVFIGPNGSGKSNIFEALLELSSFFERVMNFEKGEPLLPISYDKIWQRNQEERYLSYEVNDLAEGEEIFVSFKYFKLDNPEIGLKFRDQDTTKFPVKNGDKIQEYLLNKQYDDSSLYIALKKAKIYDFSPAYFLYNNNPNSSKSTNKLDRIGQGIANSLIDILLSNRKSFDQLEQRLTQLVPNIKAISLKRTENQEFFLRLIDKYSEYPIPAADISDGTFRLLAFLTALYQEGTPSIICFEELENGVHPWLLHKMIELLKIVSTEGINGKPVQVLITTHSPLLLNYVEPYQVRAVELDPEGKTQVHALPLESKRFQKALEAYDGELGELWFTNVFGGNPA